MQFKLKEIYLRKLNIFCKNFCKCKNNVLYLIVFIIINLIYFE